MLPNFTIMALSALIPFFFGYIWFHPNVFGGETWYNVAKLIGDDRQEVSKAKLFFTLILNFLIAFGMYNLCVHQSGLFGLVSGDVELLKTGAGAAFMAEYGHNYLTFKHGAFHGLVATILFAVPILGYVAIFEKKSFKYFMVYAGYWAISLALIGGVLCQWGTILA